jgi:hypothetical protein
MANATATEKEKIVTTHTGVVPEQSENAKQFTHEPFFVSPLAITHLVLPDMLAQLASEAQAMQTLLEHIGLLVTEEQSAFVLHCTH